MAPSNMAPMIVMTIPNPKPKPWQSTATMIRLREALFHRRGRLTTLKVKLARQGCLQVHRWMEGHVNVPTAVQSICELILVQCADFESTLPSEVVQAELAECLQRFVFRYLVTSPQISADDYVSISETGKGLRLAGSFIRLRDRILYGSELPSREELRHFAKQAMAHLKEDYWMQFGEEFVRPEQSFMLNGYRATFLSYLRADWEGMSDSAKEDVIKLALRKCGFIGGVCAEQYEAMATVLLEPGFLVPLSHELGDSLDDWRDRWQLLIYKLNRRSSKFMFRLLHGLIFKIACRDSMNFVNQARIKALEEWMTSLITDPRYFKAVNAYPAIVTRILSICEVCMDQKCANIARAMLTCVNHANLLDTYKKRITTAMKDNGIDLGKQQELDEELKETTRQAKALKVHEQDDGEDEDVDMDRSSKRSRRD